MNREPKVVATATEDELNIFYAELLCLATPEQITEAARRAGISEFMSVDVAQDILAEVRREILSVGGV